MAALTVPDHKAIVEFCIRNSEKLRGDGAPKSAAVVLAEAAKLAKGRKLGKTLATAAAEVAILETDLEKSNLKHKYWVQGLPILARMSAFDGSVAERQTLLRKEAGRASEPLRSILLTTAEILEDGADTIYDPEYWVVAQVVDPRGYLGAMSRGWHELLAAGQKKAKDIGAGDMIGGVIGGIAGAVAGAVKGGRAGGVGAAAGALAGGVDGAIKGSVAGSAKEAAGV